MEHREAAWEALAKDMANGAVKPCDITVHAPARSTTKHATKTTTTHTPQVRGIPRVVSPVRTAPKGWRSEKRRFVINMRYLNSYIPDEESSCELDTLPRVRSMFQRSGRSEPTWGFTMDLASGYHNFRVVDSQRHLLGIAIHRSELPAVAITQLQRDYPECEDSAAGLFYFELVALPFGLAPSCAVFSDIVTALAASWRRHKVCDQPVRLSSYIDDSVGVMRSLRAAHARWCP